MYLISIYLTNKLKKIPLASHVSAVSSEHSHSLFNQINYVLDTTISLHHHYHRKGLKLQAKCSVVDFGRSAAIRFGLCLSSRLMITLVKLHARWWLCLSNCLWEICVSFSLKSSFSHLEECLLDLGTVGSTGLEEHHIIVLLGPFLALGSGY